MKKISPEKHQESEFEGRLSNIISGVTRFTSGITPIRNLTTTYLSWFNLPLANEETLSWYLSASLYDGDKRSDRIGITTYMNKSRILGRNAISLTQNITIGATNTDEFGNIVTGSGTSFSSPIMAGMIACLWQAFPNKTNAEIKQLILEVSDRFASPNNQYGYGIPDFSLALSNGLSVAQVSKNDALIYPNPTNDLVSITFSTNLSKGTFMMYTILGQKVLEKNISGQSVVISLKTLNKGIYLYKLESDIYATTGKIIKN